MTLEKELEPYGKVQKYGFTCDTTRSITPPESPEAPRAGARASSSSKKITQGRAVLACKQTNNQYI